MMSLVWDTGSLMYPWVIQLQLSGGQLEILAQVRELA